ncbi:MAG TPA: hypothetical protein VNK94_12010 [Gaiellaceae bacterium]|nr:hypothetical protein [Gaiellaceae bacterium]
MLDLDGHRGEVDAAVAQCEQLALAQTGQRSQLDEVAVRSDGVGCELLDLVPAEEAHLRLIAPRRVDAEDALIDEVSALLGVREHLLEHPKRELGLARRAACERCDMVLDRGRTDLVERDTCEDVEVRQDLAYTRERRGADAQRVPIEPAGDELAERLRRRLVERTEGHTALLLENETVGVLLEHERA